MRNLLKLSALAGFCFAMVVIGACGGGKGGGGGAYTVTVNGTAYTASATASGQFTVTNGITYYKTGTDTTWHVWTGASTSTNTAN